MSEAWQPRTVGESVRITKGVTYASSDYASEDDGHVFLTIKCFAKGGGFNTEGVKYFRGVYLPEQEIAPGELLIAKTDLTRDGDIIGSPMIAPDFGEGKKALPSMDLSVLRTMDGNTDLRFLFYRLMLGDARRFMWAHSAGSTVLHLESKAFPKFTFSAPKRVEQRRIATILSTLDEAIEQTEALIAKHQQIKAGLMHDLFTRGVTPDGRLRPTREQAPDLYKESPLGCIPKEWTVGRLSQYLDPLAGIKPGPFGSSLTKDNYVSTGFRIYGQEQVIAGNLEIGDYYITEAKFLEMAAFEVLADDVLISLVGTVGCVIVVKPPLERGIINPRLMRVRPARGIVLSGFLKHLVLAANVRRQLEILAGGGTMPVINGKIIRRLVIPLLSLDGQARMVERIDARDGTLATAAEALAKLRKQKHGLMHDLLTGRVRVNFLRKE